MNRYTADAIRNIALVGHQGTGKTSFVESVLFTSGAKDRMGRVEDGNTTTDFDPAEIKRRMTIFTALAPIEWKGKKYNFLDTPGYLDFVGEVMGALRVAETALLFIAANAGVEVGTENAWDIATENRLARFFVIDKMDRENADFYQSLQSLREVFGPRVIPIQLPIGAVESFRGVVDLIRMEALVGEGREVKIAEPPGEMAEVISQWREMLVEAAAENDDELINKYLEGEELTPEEMLRGIKAGIRAGSLFPVFCCSGTQSIGIAPLLDLLGEFAPSPAEMGPVQGMAPEGKTVQWPVSEEAPPTLFIFKTTADPYVGKLTYFKVYSGVVRSDSHLWNSTRQHDERMGQLFILHGKRQEAVPDLRAGDIGAVAKLGNTLTNDTLCDRSAQIIFPPIPFPEPVYSVAVYAKTKADEDKMGPALHRLEEEDPTFHTIRDSSTGETVISGMGDMHLDVAVEALERKFGVKIEVRTPKVPYRETITSTAEAQGKYKRQTGGRGQYGDCWIRIEPLPRGAGFEFVNAIVGGVIPRQFIPAVEKGIQEAMERGYLAGYPIIDLRATVYDGSYHEVDSSELAFKIAGSLALQNAVAKDNPVLLEPIMQVEITVPEAYMGDVISDLNTKRGRVQGMEPVGGGKQKIFAQVPMAEMLRYAIDLRSITRGRGRFHSEFSHYEEVPPHLAQQIIETAKKEKEGSTHSH